MDVTKLLGAVILVAVLAGLLHILSEPKPTPEPKKKPARKKATPRKKKK